MNGKQLYEELKERNMNIPVLFISGYTKNYINRNFIFEENLSIIQKPFSIKELVSKIRKTLDKNNLKFLYYFFYLVKCCWFFKKFNVIIANKLIKFRA